MLPGGSRVRVVVLSLLQFVDVMGATMVITLLPVLLRDVGAGTAGATFVSTAYAVAFGGCLVLGARLGDVLGHRRVILLSTTVFAGAAVAAAAAPTLAILTGARFVQGLAAATTVPAALFLLTASTDDGPARHRAIATWSAAGAAAGATGFVVGGIASAGGLWRAAFMVVGVVAAALGLMAWWMLRSEDAVRSSSSLDVAGGATLTLSVGLIVAATALSERDGGTALLLGAAALGAGALLVLLERRAAAPILPAAVLESPQVRRGSMVSFVNTATTSSAATLVTLSLQEDLGSSGIATAFVLLPFSLTVICGAWLAPGLMRRTGSGVTMAAGLAGIGTGIALLPVVHDELPGVALGMALSGFGIGLASSAATHVGTSVEKGIRAASGAVVNTAAQLGTALGIALSLAVALRWGSGPAWLTLAALAFCTALVAARWGSAPSYSGARDDA